MNRFDRVLNEMRSAGISQMIVSDPISIKYLTGIVNYPGERLYALLLRADNEPVLFANRLFHITRNDIRIVWYEDNDDPVKLIAGIINRNEPLGIDKDWPARFLIPLLDSCSNLAVSVASDCIDNVRAIKDEEEIRLMKIASRLNDQVIMLARDFIREGMTEKEVARYITEKFVELGCDGNSFGPIVSFGPTAADPHHGPDGTVLKDGDVVLIDMGCLKDGYCSDMTRTFIYGSASEKLLHVYDLVKRANEAAEAIIKPGVRLCDIDAAARNVIAEAGYGQYFTHRTGHFIGQAVHEKGDVSSSYTNEVKSGMIFSIEPGIYLPGEFGVRIEDLVLVTEDGCEPLNRVSKEPYIIKKPL